MLTFDAPLFALAGILAAAGPLVVHLLNRRRFRVVAWGAMDFLRQALERHRRAFELRDLLVLMLRMLVICLLGFALARPFLQGGLGGGLISGGALLLLSLCAIVAAATAAMSQRPLQRRLATLFAVLATTGAIGLWGWSATNTAAAGSTAGAGRVPVHAVLILDNSRSMGVSSTAGTRFDRVLQTARQFLSELPAGSRTTLIPAAGSEQALPLDAYALRADVERELNAMSVVDTADDIVGALELAELACQRVTEPDIKRVVYLTDLQSPNWNRIDWTSWAQRLPGLQIAPVSEGNAPNLVVESLELEDGFAGAESPSRFLARIRADDLLESTSVEVVLRVNDVTVGSQVLPMAAGQTRELEFAHQFDVGGEPGRPNWSTATLEIRPDNPAADRLAADNLMTILVPVLDMVPVVFVDQYGDREDVTRGRIGETYALRHLLAPRIADDEAPRRLIHVEHVLPDAVTPELLESARLVVVGGVESPELLTSTLREYVQQGGPLVLLAGGEFDARAWQSLAWQDGQGILPLPLNERPLGSLPTTTASLDPFFVDFPTLEGHDFRIEGEDPQLLADLFESTPFFQAVVMDTRPAVLEELAVSSRARWAADLKFLQDQAALPTGDARSPQDRDRLRRLEPNWWLWRNSLPIISTSATLDQLVEQERPQVRARFTREGHPWVVERQLGRGKVLFFASGVTSDWNLLRTSGAMYVFHRALFRLMSETLPPRNAVVGQRTVLPLPPSGDKRWELSRPSGLRENLPSEILEAGITGVSLRRNVVSGMYQLHAVPIDGKVLSAAAPPAPDSTVLAKWVFQGDPTESRLAGSGVVPLRQQVADAPVMVLNVGESPRLEGGQRRGERIWQWGILAAILGLTSEMAVLGQGRWRRSEP